MKDDLPVTCTCGLQCFHRIAIRFINRIGKCSGKKSIRDNTHNKKAKQESGFSDRRSENYRRPPKTGEETVEQRIRQLENELAYTRQEVEFLKKLQAAILEALKQWESKHRQK